MADAGVRAPARPHNAPGPPASARPAQRPGLLPARQPGSAHDHRRGLRPPPVPDRVPGRAAVSLRLAAAGAGGDRRGAGRRAARRAVRRRARGGPGPGHGRDGPVPARHPVPAQPPVRVAPQGRRDLGPGAAPGHRRRHGAEGRICHAGPSRGSRGRWPTLSWLRRCRRWRGWSGAHRPPENGRTTSGDRSPHRCRSSPWDRSSSWSCCSSRTWGSRPSSWTGHSRRPWPGSAWPTPWASSRPSPSSGGGGLWASRPRPWSVCCWCSRSPANARGSWRRARCSSARSPWPSW